MTCVFVRACVCVWRGGTREWVRDAARLRSMPPRGATRPGVRGFPLAKDVPGERAAVRGHCSHPSAQCYSQLRTSRHTCCYVGGSRGIHVHDEGEGEKDRDLLGSLELAFSSFSCI
jgi:hypothetical protein